MISGGMLAGNLMDSNTCNPELSGFSKINAISLQRSDYRCVF